MGLLNFALPGRKLWWGIAIGIVGLAVVIFWFRGHELRDTQKALIISDAAKEAAVAVSVRQAKTREIDDSIVTGVIRQLEQNRRQQARERSDVFNEYLQRVQGLPVASESSDGVVKPPFKVDASVSVVEKPQDAPSDRERLDRLSQRLWDIYCQANTTTPTNADCSP